MSKRAKSLRTSKILDRKRKKLLLIPFLALFVKVFIIARIQGFDWYAFSSGDAYRGLTEMVDKNYAPAHAWYGADGENYIRGLTGLLKDGFFSSEGKLSYWPAGYPLLLWPLVIVFKGQFFFALALLQSILYAVASAFFVDEVSRSRLNKYSFLSALLLSLNPTLALNTIAVGYELPTLALVLIGVAAFIRALRLSKKKLMSSELLIASFSLFLATLMQPRLILFAIVIFSIWALAIFPLKSASIFLITAMSIVALAPGIMMFRNSKANGYVAISTNLGTTMNIGAGYESTGGYTNQATGVNCPPTDGNSAQQDSARVKCILKWYVNNPKEFLRLSWNKTVYFWSPWFGPAGNGTMARNPWRINHPLADTVKTESGFKLVYGNFGKFVSWVWMLATLMFMLFGLRFLIRAGNLERAVGIVAFSIVVVNWITTVATIGDNRFRIPTMGVSIFLQAIGFANLFIRGRKRLSGTPVKIEWPGLHWKRQVGTDNLPS